MKTREAILKTKNFKDEFGFDLADNTGLKTKQDCINRLMEHQKWLQDHCQYAIHEIDNLISEIRGY